MAFGRNGLEDWSNEDPDERWLRETMKRRGVPLRPPKPVADVVSQLMARRGYASVRSSNAITEAWEEVIDERMKAGTRATRVSRGVLHVQIADSVLMQELMFIKQDVIEKLNQILDKPIQDLRFRVGPL